MTELEQSPSASWPSSKAKKYTISRRDFIGPDQYLLAGSISTNSLLKLVCSRWLRLCWVLLFVVPLLVLMTASNKYTVRLVLLTGTQSSPEIFFAQSDQDFAAKNSLPLQAAGQEDVYEAKWGLSGAKQLSKLRIDPTDKIGSSVTVSALVLKSAAGEVRWDAEALKNAGNPDLLLRSSEMGQAVFDVVGVDPQLVLDVPAEVGVWTLSLWCEQYVRIAVFVFFGWCLLEWLAFSALFRKANIKAMCDSLDRVGACFSEPSTIEFKASSVLVLVVMVILALLFVSLKLHQSSIGRWDQMYGHTKVDRWIDWGAPKGIRSDEWNVQTPWVLNQVQRGQAIRNPNIGGGESAFIVSTPVSGWVKLAQPKFWGFSFLDLERGFSWVWAYKLFGLLFSFFLLFLFLTRSQTLLSVAGTAWVLGSSFVQWWYSSHLPEILIGFALGVTGALYLSRASRIGGIIFGALLFVYSIWTLLLHAYPAFIIPLAYLGFFVVFGVLWQDKSYTINCAREKRRWFVLFLSVTAVVCFVLAWMFVARETIHLMTQTVYPGKRYDLGGAMPLERLWYGFFEAIRVSEGDFPLPPSNASEASSFLLLFPLLFLLIKPLDWLKAKNRLLLVLMAYCVFLFAWMALPLPLSMREIIASMGWSMTTSSRAELGLGIASILAVMVWVSQKASQNELRAGARLMWPRWVVALLASALVLVFGLRLHEFDPSFFNFFRVVLATVLVALVIAALVYRFKWGLLGALLLFLAPSFTVNPIQSGLDSVMNKPILNKAYSLGHGPEDRWAVIGDFVFSQGLKARGLDVITGSNFSPNFELIRVLDQNDESKYVWNRYAHVVFASDPSAVRPVFNLIGPDIYSIRLNVCGSDVLKVLGVRRLVYTNPVPNADLECLSLLTTENEGHVSFFEIK